MEVFISTQFSTCRILFVHGTVKPLNIPSEIAFQERDFNLAFLIHMAEIVVWENLQGRGTAVVSIPSQQAGWALRNWWRGGGQETTRTLGHACNYYSPGHVKLEGLLFLFWGTQPPSTPWIRSWRGRQEHHGCSSSTAISLTYSYLNVVSLVILTEESEALMGELHMLNRMHYGMLL